MLHTGLSQDVIDRLPSPKGIALALSKACRREDANLDEIAGLVRTDPALSGRVLALSNAAALGGRTLVSVEEAVSRMGLARVNQVALAFSLIDQHGAGVCHNFNYAGFWNHSLLMAAACSQFGAPRRLGPAGDLFTVGLLAQIGRLSLATAFPAEYSELIAQDIGPAELLARERTLTGIDHLSLSVALMEHWGIPQEYARAFGQHEEAPGAADGLAAQRAVLAHGTWLLARVIAREGMDAVAEDAQCMAALKWLGLGPEELRTELQEIETLWRVWLALISRRA